MSQKIIKIHLKITANKTKFFLKFERFKNIVVAKIYFFKKKYEKNGKKMKNHFLTFFQKKADI